MSEETALCKNCGHEVATQSMMMHEVQCARHNARCHCGLVVPRKDLETHEQEVHTKVQCPYCHKDFEKAQMAEHRCLKAPKLCEFCELQFPGDLLRQHAEECGNRTEQCLKCKRYIPKKIWAAHSSSVCMPELPREPVHVEKPKIRPGGARLANPEIGVRPQPARETPRTQTEPEPVKAANPDIGARQLPAREGPRARIEPEPAKVTNHEVETHHLPGREAHKTRPDHARIANHEIGTRPKPPREAPRTRIDSLTKNAVKPKQRPDRDLTRTKPDAKLLQEPVRDKVADIRGEPRKPITRKPEESKTASRANQPTVTVKPSRQEEEDFKLAKAYQLSLLEAQAEEDAKLARLIAEEAGDTGFHDDDELVAKRLAEEDKKRLMEEDFRMAQQMGNEGVQPSYYDD